jgi:hypothetical protein
MKNRHRHPVRRYFHQNTGKTAVYFNGGTIIIENSFSQYRHHHRRRPG